MTWDAPNAAATSRASCCEACHELLTFLVPPDDPALRRATLLRAAADHWLNALSTRVRFLALSVLRGS